MSYKYTLTVKRDGYQNPVLQQCFYRSQDFTQSEAQELVNSFAAANKISYGLTWWVEKTAMLLQGQY